MLINQISHENEKLLYLCMVMVVMSATQHTTTNRVVTESDSCLPERSEVSICNTLVIL